MRFGHKYKAKPTSVDGIRFASKAEARYYQDLLERQERGEVLFFLRQVPLHLPGNTKYVVDFVEFLAPDDRGHADIRWVDVKGVETPMFKLKKKQVESLYPIEISIEKAGSPQSPK